MSPHRRTVGLLVTETSSPYQAAVLDALAAVCEERDTNLVVFSGVYLMGTGGRDAARPFAARLAGPRNIDALIVPSLGNLATTDQLVEFLASYGALPVCTVSMSLPGFPNVQIDNALGFSGVVRHLVDVHRLRRFVFLSRPPEHVEGRLRRRAFGDTLAAYGIDPLPDIVVPGDPAFDPGLIHRALSQAGPIDAIVAVDDYLIPSLMVALDELGSRVPEDVAVTGFDDSDIARGGTPPLTSVRQPFYAMLDAALTSVLERLDGREVPSEVLIVPELVTRRSCGCRTDWASIYPAGQRDPASIATLLAQEHEPVVSAWRQTPGLRVPPGSWENELFATFVADLLGGGRELGPCFSTLLSQHCAKGGEVQAWHPVITSLRRRCMPLVTGEPVLEARAEALLQRLRIQLGGIEVGRAQGQRIRSEVLSRQQAIVAERLLRNLNREYLIAALPELFLQLGVRTYWFSTYPNANTPESAAVLSSAVVSGRPLELSTAPEPFEPVRLLPEDQRNTKKRYTWIVSPVHDEESQLGLLVFDYFREYGVIFDIMALQIGAALHGARLVKRIAEETERRERAERERLEQELELAQGIQTSILPRNLTVPGLEIAATMVPATEVGGDYYDVLPLPNGCIIGIGDVVGHGLKTGLIMMMVQSAVAAAVAMSPNLTPRQAIIAANQVLFDNIQNRLQRDEHVTLTLLRYETGGLFTFAGAHEDMLVYRARSDLVEVVRVTGFFAGALPTVAELTTDERMQLEPGDVLLLYTDGSTEAFNAKHERFGFDRLGTELRRVGSRPAAEIRDHLLAEVKAWLHEQDDDIAFVVVRYTGAA